MSYKGFLSHSIVSKEDQGFHDLKNKAAEHYRSTGVPQKIETVLNEMFWQKPDDIYGYLMVCSAVMDGPCDGLADGVAESGEVFFNSNQHNQQRLSITTALKWIREHLSPMLQGFNPTDQTNLDKVLSDFFMARYLEYKDSLNREEEDELKNESVSEALTPAPAKDKKGGDKEFRLSEVATGGQQPILVQQVKNPVGFKDKRAQNETHLPALMIIILSCGKNSLGKLNLLEEFILMPSSSQRVREVIGMGLELQCEMRRVLNGSAYKAGKKQNKQKSYTVGVTDKGALQVGFKRREQALDLVTEACANLALALGSDLRLAINCEAHGLMDYVNDEKTQQGNYYFHVHPKQSRGKYEVISGCHKSPDELLGMYEGLINKYPAITSLIDPFRKEARLKNMILNSLCTKCHAAHLVERQHVSEFRM
ncbi:hypothetical protein cypCar_00000922 [Cyprinus carpio]|nr:hypothetical protein cypCar_00000922 [Cyprinus carpio]